MNNSRRQDTTDPWIDPANCEVVNGWSDKLHKREPGAFLYFCARACYLWTIGTRLLISASTYLGFDRNHSYVLVSTSRHTWPAVYMTELDSFVQLPAFLSTAHLIRSHAALELPAISICVSSKKANPFQNHCRSAKSTFSSQSSIRQETEHQTGPFPRRDEPV